MGLFSSSPASGCSKHTSEAVQTCSNHPDALRYNDVFELLMFRFTA